MSASYTSLVTTGKCAGMVIYDRNERGSAQHKCKAGRAERRRLTTLGGWDGSSANFGRLALGSLQILTDFSKHSIFFKETNEK